MIPKINKKYSLLHIYAKYTSVSSGKSNLINYLTKKNLIINHIGESVFS